MSDYLAWRNKKRGKAHRVADKGWDTACGYAISLADWKSVSLTQTDPADLCRWCYPDSGGAGADSPAPPRPNQETP